jgi:hypothetical protein
MHNILAHLGMLGFRVKDRVTGAEGIVTSVSFDLYGCVQAIVNPGLDKDGKQRDQFWFDIARLETTSDGPVMAVPDFIEGAMAEGRHGPAEKPAVTRP